MAGSTRRDILKAAAAAATGFRMTDLWAQAPSTTSATVTSTAPTTAPVNAEVLHPCGRVPVSFFIDDSTCLVNMGHFCMPQFAEAWPDRPEYKKPWKSWPREIPDTFVREFGEFCALHGVRGKYSVVPFPACVGWLDRELPGWSRQDLRESLKLMRGLMLPNWDIHPEMITHTRVIDLRTGRPFGEISSATMENSYPQEKKSVDELAAYMAYALRILKNCDLPCEGVTTPGGFGNQVKPELGLAVRQAVSEVFGTEIPHYFKYVIETEGSTAPKIEHLEDEQTDEPRLVVSVPAGTGDWFGGWDGADEPRGDRYATADGSAGRMIELIGRGEPAVMLCHWPGLYCNGTKIGFEHFKRVIGGIENRYRRRIIWMKISEIARYWAARQLTRIERQESQWMLTAPFACPNFTLRLRVAPNPPTVLAQGQHVSMVPVSDPALLSAGRCLMEETGLTICLDLPKGKTVISV